MSVGMELRYINCIKLQFYDKKVVINRNEILRCIVPLLRERGIGLDVIQAIGMIGNSFTWYVEFSDASVQKCLIGVTAVLKDQKTIIEDADDRSVVKTFRVTNLPRYGSNAFLENNFKKFGTVISINEEMYEDKEYKVKLSTGNKYVKVKFNNEQQKRLNEIYGVKKFQNQRFIIQMLGHKNCFLCGQTNHIKKDCPRKDLKCTKCKERGHEETECTIARRLFKSNFDELCCLEDDDEGDGESIVTPKPTSEARGNEPITSEAESENEAHNSTVVEINGKKDGHLMEQQLKAKFVTSTPGTMNNRKRRKIKSPNNDSNDSNNSNENDQTEQMEQPDDKNKKIECSYLGNISSDEETTDTKKQ